MNPKQHSVLTDPQGMKAERPEIVASVSKSRERLALDTLKHVAKLSPSHPEWMLDALALGGKQALECEKVRVGLRELIDRRDPRFFEFAAQIDGAGGFDERYLLRATDRVKLFLTDYWILDEGASIGFSGPLSLTYYSFPALAKLIAWHFGTPLMDWHAIRQVVRRLGLKKSRYTLFRDIQVSRRGKSMEQRVLPIPFEKRVPRKVNKTRT
jgi:hypothetical protein